MRATSFACFVFFLSTSLVFGQSDFIINKAKNLKTEYTPVPKDFKTKKLSWGAVGTFCNADSVEFGNWYALYPYGDRIKVTVSTGFNWGNLSNPLIYIAYLDTVEGIETLVPLGCEQFSGDQGDYALEVLNLRLKRKHYMLIGAEGKKQKYALYLTQKFDAALVNEDEKVDAPATEDALSETPDSGLVGIEDQTVKEKPSTRPSSTTVSEGSGVIMGRLRKSNGKELQGADVVLLDDDLKEVGRITSDESGVFRFDGVLPEKMNLIRIGGVDDKVQVDMFLYDVGGNILAKTLPLGHQMYSFKKTEPQFRGMNILTEQDVVVMVKRGKSTMLGKVVDAQTYLIGREGVRVGLYTPKKRLLRSAISDEDGEFLFTQLDQQDYIVKVDHNPEEDYVEIVLADDENNPYAISTSEDLDMDGYFRFRKLPKQSIDMDTIDAEDESGFQHHYYTMLSEEEPGVPYELHSIQFAVGSSSLPGQNDELDQLARELLESPKTKIKIDGHTDNVGQGVINKALSLERAEAVKDYLVRKGVKADRITCQGFGSSVPIAENDTQRGRSLNRRVEFSIVELPK